MAIESTRHNVPRSRTDILTWLMDTDPSISWEVLRDLTNAPPAAIGAERARVATDGWGARLLDLQQPDGNWDGAVWLPGRWTSTFETIVLLKDLGVDPADERVCRAIHLVRDNVTWGAEFGDSPFFDGEMQACINGRTLAAGVYFGEASDLLVEKLLAQQLPDGGWTCDEPRDSTRPSAFSSTICVLEGLLAYERATDGGVAVRDARERGQQFLLGRGLLRSARIQPTNPAWTRFSFPARYHFDVLRGLDYLRSAGVEPDERVAEAIELVRRKQSDDGTWPLENPHPGEVYFELEGKPGAPSRWNTLRALRVLDWAST